MGYDQIYHLAISVALGREVQRAEGLHWLIQLGYWTGLWDSRSCLGALKPLSLIHISEPTRLGMKSNDVFC